MRDLDGTQHGRSELRASLQHQPQNHLRPTNGLTSATVSDHDDALDFPSDISFDLTSKYCVHWKTLAMILFAGREAHSRSLAKAISWRLAGTIDTFVISTIITGKPSLAGTIAGVELFTKIFLYYFHERIWAVVPWGNSK